MSYIEIQNLTFGYENSADNIFQNVSLHIDGSWKLGLIGRNGRGKTTFLQLLMKNYTYSGSIHTDLQFAYFPFRVERPDRLTIEIMQEVCAEAQDWELIREAELLDIHAEDLYRPFAELSGGEQTKILLAAMFAGENRFMLLDEPTNHMDAEGREKIEAYLQQKTGFILVSHDRKLLDACVDHIISINKTTIDLQQGNFSSWWENFNRQEAYETAENEKLKKDIKRLTQAAGQSAEWSAKVERSKKGSTNSGSKLDKGYVGHKAAKMMQRSKAIEARMQNAAADKAALLKNVESIEKLQMQPAVYDKDLLLTAKDLSLYYDDRCICRHISFEVHKGDRIALDGKNGCGKSTLLKLISGSEIRYDGELIIGSQMKISCVPQSAAFLRGGIRAYAEENELDASLLMTVLRKLGFEREQFDNPMESMSEGQKKKILIAGSLCTPAHLYIWDEPLNYIDILSKTQIEDLILTYQPTILFVEHDRLFREKIATKTVTL